MKRFFAIPILILVAFVVFMYLTLPQYKKYNTASHNANIRQVSLEGKIKNFSDLRKTAEKLEKYEEAMAKIDTALPLDSSFPSLFDYIQKMASSNGLILTSVSPATGASAKEAEITSRVKEMNFGVSLIGSPESLESFLITVEKSARMFEVVSISMGASEEELSAIEIAMKAHSYFQMK